MVQGTGHRQGRSFPLGATVHPDGVNRNLPANRLGMTGNELPHHVPVHWHGTKLNRPGWGHKARIGSATLRLLEGRVMIHLMVNAYWEALDFEMPPSQTRGQAWRRCLDTFLDSPEDICDWADAPVVKGSVYWVQPRSVVLLLAKHQEPEMKHAGPRTGRSRTQG